jgi:hypothetical protein
VLHPMLMALIGNAGSSPVTVHFNRHARGKPFSLGRTEKVSEVQTMSRC